MKVYIGHGENFDLFKLQREIHQYSNKDIVQLQSKFQSRLQQHWLIQCEEMLLARR